MIHISSLFVCGFLLLTSTKYVFSLSLNLSSSLQISNIRFWGCRPQDPGCNSSGQRSRWRCYILLHNSRQRGRKFCHWQPERWYFLIFQPGVILFSSHCNRWAFCQIALSRNGLYFQRQCEKILKADNKSYISYTHAALSIIRVINKIYNII